MKPTAIVLIDGEHYPEVVVDALKQAGDRFDFKAAVFLGGTEKIASSDFGSTARAVYGLPVVLEADPGRGLARAIEDYRPEVVVDLSDEPVLGYKGRFRLISEALARNVGYLGPDFRFSPTSSDRVCTSPSVAVIGTGKRVGKTAVSGYLVRVLQEVITGRDGHPGVVVVAMGRGGPAEPELIDGASSELTIADLLALSRQGRHAASDYLEDALLSRVTTIGCRRCGGGMAGEPFLSNVPQGVRLANSLAPGLIVLEGSGSAIPDVAADARVLIAGAHQPREHVAGYLGAYRLLVSDALVLTMAEEPLASFAKVQALSRAASRVKPGIRVVTVVLRPEPAGDIAGRRVAFFCTAPRTQEVPLCEFIRERFGGRVEMFSANLADRRALKADFARPEMAHVEVVLTEIKAAAIDVVAEEAGARGLPVVPVDNVPVEVPPSAPGQLRQVVRQVALTAKERFESRT